MTTIRKMMGRSVAMALVLVGLTAGAQAFVPDAGLSPFGGEARGVTQVIGSVVCVGCSLNEVRAAQPDLQRLYQLNHEQGQLIMTVESVNNAARWESIVGLSHQLSVRAPQSLFQQLAAEENLFREVEIRGLLRSNQTLDIGEITISGPIPEPLAPFASQEPQKEQQDAY